MSVKRSLYLVPKTLDAPKRILGLPLDEFFSGAIFCVFFFVLGKLILAMILPVIMISAIKMLKDGQGSAWLMNICYWYLPKCVTAPLFRKTPASQHREYIA